MWPFKSENQKRVDFLQACQTGELSVVQRYVNKNGDPNVSYTAGKGQTGLILSIANHQRKIRDYLLSLNTIDVNRKLFNGFTPLMVAISIEDMDSFNLLLHRDDIQLDARATGDNPCTALLIACQPNKKGFINAMAAIALMEAGANVNLAGKFNETPLIAASAAGCLPVVDALCNAGADLDPKETQWHLNACETAVRNGHSEIAERLSQERQKRSERIPVVPLSHAPATLIDHQNNVLPVQTHTPHAHTYQ